MKRGKSVDLGVAPDGRDLGRGLPDRLAEPPAAELPPAGRWSTAARVAITMSPQVLPVRMYRTHDRIMVAAPMPGLEPTDITVTVDGDRVVIEGRQRGPHQHERDLMLAEWTIGPYYRELQLLRPVRADLVNATYDNGVLVLVMPTLDTGEPPVRAEIRLEPIEATRGEHVGHSGRNPQPTTTPQHRIGKHETSHKPRPVDRLNVTSP